MKVKIIKKPYNIFYCYKCHHVLFNLKTIRSYNVILTKYKVNKQILIVNLVCVHCLTLNSIPSHQIEKIVMLDERGNNNVRNG